MLPTPIISTETLASCAAATQTEAPKAIDANSDRFIIHQFILAPLARTPKIGCCVSSSDRDFYRNAAVSDARNVRGTIQGSVNADSLQHHHESGCSVTNDCGVSFLPLALEGAMDDARFTTLLGKLVHQSRRRAGVVIKKPTVDDRACLRSRAGHRLFDRRQRRIGLGSIGTAGLRHVGPPAAAF